MSYDFDFTSLMNVKDALLIIVILVGIFIIFSLIWGDQSRKVMITSGLIVSTIFACALYVLIPSAKITEFEAHISAMESISAKADNLGLSLDPQIEALLLGVQKKQAEQHFVDPFGFYLPEYHKANDLLGSQQNYIGQEKRKVLSSVYDECLFDESLKRAVKKSLKFHPINRSNLNSLSKAINEQSGELSMSVSCTTAYETIGV